MAHLGDCCQTAQLNGILCDSLSNTSNGTLIIIIIICGIATISHPKGIPRGVGVWAYDWLGVMGLRA